MSLGLLLLPGFQSRPTRIEFLSYDRAEPLLTGNRFSLPADLTGTRETVRAAWPRWLEGRDREILSRLLRGEEDTLVNFVLYGVSFTDRPRVEVANGASEATSRLIAERIQHVLTAVSKPNTDRLTLLSSLMTRLGYATGDGVETERLRQYVDQQVFRYLAERQQYLATEPSTPFNAASGLYKNRGLSVDTDFRPNYAIEQGLAEVKRRGLLRSVKRAAIIGPGLDFTDKDSGFDYYPLQTLQPFALIDSLIRLDMARATDLKVSVFDISPQSLDHV